MESLSIIDAHQTSVITQKCTTAENYVVLAKIKVSWLSSDI